MQVNYHEESELPWGGEGPMSAEDDTGRVNQKKGLDLVIAAAKKLPDIPGLSPRSIVRAVKSHNKRRLARSSSLSALRTGQFSKKSL